MHQHAQKCPSKVKAASANAPTLGYNKFIDDLRFIIEDGEPNSEDKEAVIQGLLSYYKKQGHAEKKIIFQFF